MVTKAKRNYFKQVINKNKDNPKQLWQAMNSLLSRNIPKSLPCASSPSALASSFLNFFNDKIANLCASIPPCVNSFFFAETPYHLYLRSFQTSILLQRTKFGKLYFVQ